MLIFPFHFKLRAEAQMFAHTNNEGIWGRKHCFLLVGVEGHQLPDNTHLKDTGCTQTCYS